MLTFVVNKFFSKPNRFDSILGKDGSKGKDSYESKLSLACRIVKVERTVSVDFGCFGRILYHPSMLI